MNARAVLGDITKLEVDAIVNAANSSLLGGSGVDGAIHRAAGPGLAIECLRLGGCKTGEAKITAGHRLRAKWIIHTVGPVWRGGGHGEADHLASCYASSLDLAIEKGAKTIAFPCISTGIYRFPVEAACFVALEATLSHPRSSEVDELVFCCFDEPSFSLYQSRLALRAEG